MANKQQDIALGKRALALNLIDAMQLGDCLQFQERCRLDGTEVPLAQVLVDKGYLQPFQINQIQPRESFGRYKIIEELGHGGMGIVYKAHDPTLDRIVAIKVILGTSHVGIQRFLRETQVMAKLQHPNIATVYERGNEAGQNFFTMDFIEGTPGY